MTKSCPVWLKVKAMKVMRLVNSHNHAAPSKPYTSAEHEDACTIRGVLKEQAVAQTDVQPQQLVTDVLAQFAEAGIGFVGDKQYLVHMVRNARLRASRAECEPSTINSIALAEVVKTSKGMDALKCPLGYVYNFSRQNKRINTAVYICAKRPKCQARIHARGNEIVKIAKGHNHQPVFQ